MIRCDTLIKNGNICDGTGNEVYVSDIAIKNGVIVAVGPNLQTFHDELIDATGLLVTPGFVDVHTHYDGQITWDPYCSPSTQHGVTTLMFGNCGVGFAPCRPEDRSKLIGLLEGVEDIPGTALHEGMEFKWETFPEYMDFLSKQETACDFLAMACHVPIRVYAMGDRAEKTPTVEELKYMRELVAEAMECGAVGLSTSRTLLHRDLEGTVVPGTYGDKLELTELMCGMAQGGGGIFEMVQDFADHEIEMDWISKLSAGFGVKVSFGFGPGSERRVKSMFDLLEKANETMGAQVTGQVAVKIQGLLQNLGSKFHPFVGHPTYVSELAGLALKERRELFSHPAMRKRILGEKSGFGDAPFAKNMFNPQGLYVLNDIPNYEPGKNECVYELAKRKGCTIDELMYDLLAEGKTLTAMGGGGKKGTALLERTKRLMEHPWTVVGLGDGGAHLGLLSEAPCPTFMLTHWVRDRTVGTGAIPLAKAIKLQTHDTAELVGLNDRGVIAKGKRADINIIDFENLQLLKPQLVHDLPTNATRWMQKSTGYVRTLVKGVTTFKNGEPTGALPGRLVRNPLAQQLKGRIPHITSSTNALDIVDIATIPQPRSTNDTLVDDKDLVGGASAMARAARKNLAAAERVTSTGNMLSGKVLNQVGLDSRGKPLKNNSKM